MSRTRVLPLLVVLLAATGCSPSMGRDTDDVPPDPEPESTEPVEVMIRSFHSQPVRIHLMRGGTAHRLGVVAEGRGRTFTIPADFYGGGRTFVFVFTLVGGGEEYRSGMMTLQAGNYVEWTVAERLKYSTVFVW